MFAHTIDRTPRLCSTEEDPDQTLANVHNYCKHMLMVTFTSSLNPPGTVLLIERMSVEARGQCKT